MLLRLLSKDRIIDCHKINMQHSISEHPESQDWYAPPTHVAKKLIAHAVRNIPNKHILLDKLFPRKVPLKQMQTHKYDSGGRLQWAFMN